MTTIAPPHLPNYNITFDTIKHNRWQYVFGPITINIKHVTSENDPHFEVWYDQHKDDWEESYTMERVVEQVERWLRQWAEYFDNLDKSKGWISLTDEPVPLQTFLCSKDPKLPPVVLHQFKPSLWASEGQFYYRWSEVTDRFTHYKTLALQEES
jgi:hypothetical protein